MFDYITKYAKFPSFFISIRLLDKIKIRTIIVLYRTVLISTIPRGGVFIKRTTEFLTNIRRIVKLHESMLKAICVEYRLTLIEATIISFLHNNPGKDTAADIVELRMLSKGNVSQAVESLIQKALLRREPDTADRRRIHLFLTPAAGPIVASMEVIWRQYEETIFAGLTAEDKALFDKVNRRMMENAQNAMTRRDTP